MTQFFANNFNEDRWRKAALKNAYALLGKQRFDHAAAFFLLAGNLKDAVEVSRMKVLIIIRSNNQLNCRYVCTNCKTFN